MESNLSNVELKRLAEKVLKGTASEEEYNQLNEWYLSFDDRRFVLSASETRRELREKLLKGISTRIDGSTTRNRRRTGGLLLKTASVITMTLFSIAVFYIKFLRTDTRQGVASVIIETKSADLGQKKTVRLPDGTMVKLNSGSEIKFPNTFSDHSRAVELSGEAFFDVVRDESKPFIIQTTALTVEVLGTSFNVKSYPNDQFIDVAVKTGKVKVTNKADAVGAILSPDEMVSYSTYLNTLRKKTIIDKNKIFGWVDGNLVFRDTDFREVVTTISRWYGVEIKMSEHPGFKKTITANLGAASLQEVLETLSHNYNFNYKIDEKIVIITLDH